MTLPLDPKAPPTSSLDGVLERVVFSNEENAWSVVKIVVLGRQDLVTAVGNLLGVQPGESLRLQGEWIDDPKYGRQFKVASYRTVAPSTVTGIEKYLGSGLIQGIGKVMASRLVKAFGKETLDVIEHQPERLREVEGIGPGRSSAIQRAWIEQRDIKEVMVFLQSHGVSTQYAIRIYKTYGPAAVDVVRENPYRLALDIHGIGFKSADRIATALGIDPAAPQRLEAGVLHLLSEGGNRGHLFLPRRTLVETAVNTLSEGGQVVVEPSSAAPDDRDEAAVYPKALHLAETGIASRVR